MASAFSHAVAAATIGSAFYRRGLPGRFWVLGAACAIAPDADVIGVALGVPFRSLLGHRGLTHSLAFAAVLAAVVLRADTRGGLARATLALLLPGHGLPRCARRADQRRPRHRVLRPFDNARYFLLWRPVVVSPIGIRPFFSAWGLRVIESELLWIWLPSLMFVAMTILVRKRLGAAVARSQM